MESIPKKERPIIFSGEMVKAILEGRKTQTRRALNHQPAPFRAFDDPGPFLWFRWNGYPQGRIRLSEFSEQVAPCCPYGQPGDRLYVREAWAIGENRKDGPQYWYKATEERSAPLWRSPMFMPRAASRILLEVVSVRVERVQEISEEDAKAEGVCAIEGQPLGDYRQPYAILWDTVNFRRGFGWKANPWVWCIEFKRIESQP